MSRFSLGHYTSTHRRENNKWLSLYPIVEKFPPSLLHLTEMAEGFASTQLPILKALKVA